jgi:hypothetical protein
LEQQHDDDDDATRAREGDDDAASSMEATVREEGSRGQQLWAWNIHLDDRLVRLMLMLVRHGV